MSEPGRWYGPRDPSLSRRTFECKVITLERDALGAQESLSSSSSGTKSKTAEISCPFLAGEPERAMD